MYFAEETVQIAMKPIPDCHTFSYSIKNQCLDTKYDLVLTNGTFLDLSDSEARNVIFNITCSVRDNSLNSQIVAPTFVVDENGKYQPVLAYSMILSDLL